MTLLSITGWCSTHGTESFKPPYPCQDKSTQLTKWLIACSSASICFYVFMITHTKISLFSFFAFSAAAYIEMKVKCYSERQASRLLIWSYCWHCSLCVHSKKMWRMLYMKEMASQKLYASWGNTWIYRTYKLLSAITSRWMKSRSTTAPISEHHMTQNQVHFQQTFILCPFRCGIV